MSGPPGAPPPPRAADSTGEATLEIFRESPGYTEFLWEALSGISPRPCAGRVLEVGCGLGNLTRLILRSPGVERLHAIDLEPAYVERLRRELADPRLSVETARAEEFRPDAFRGEESGFDFVVSSNVLEHIDDDAAALANFRAVLRPSGLVLVLVPAHPALYSSLDRALSHRRRYRPEDLERVARAASLAVLRVRHFNPLGALGWWLNGKVLRRARLPRGQVSLYSRWALGLSRWLDRWNPFPIGVSLIAALAPKGLAPPDRP